MPTLTACPRCRTAVPPGQTNCLRCGHAADQPVRVCAGCGHRNDADSRFCARCGHGLDALVAPATPPERPHPDATKVLLDAGPRPRGFVVALAILVALCVVVAGLEVVGHEFFSPTRTVQSFFDALASRNAAAARRLLVSDDAEAPLLQNAALKNGGYAPPTAVRVERADVADGRASVRVSFALSGRRQNATLTLQRDDDATAGLFHGWHIEDGVNEFGVAGSDVSAVDVAGVTIALSEDAESSGFSAFPGSYRVSLPEQPLWTAPPVTALVGLGDPGEPVSLEPTIKDSARSEVEKQVRAWVDECARSTELSPPNCPFEAGAYDQVDHVRWKVVTYPAVELDRDYDGHLVVSTTTQGEAEVSGRAVPYYGGSSYAYRDTVAFGAGGEVNLAGTTITFQPYQQ